MTKKEFREKLNGLKAAAANAEGESLREIEAQIKALREEYQDEIADMQREAAEKALAQNREDETPSIVAMLRESRKQRQEVNMRAALTVAGAHDNVVETKIQDILKPLYADSALSKLGVKWFKGMPMGDISIPVMSKGNVHWENETAIAQDGTPNFGTNITLKPYRLTGFFDISEKMLLQDTIGVNAALQEEAVKALANAFEATVLGDGSGLNSESVRVSPAGLFYNKTLSDATTFAKVCELESEVEDACVGGELKYLLGTKAKADFRSMAKSTKNTQLVMEGGMIDGTPAVVTQNVHKETGSKKEGIFAFGNFQNLACASWSDLIFKVDDLTQYGNGKVRIYVSGYFDAAVLREGAFVYGNTRFA